MTIDWSYIESKKNILTVPWIVTGAEGADMTMEEVQKADAVSVIQESVDQLALSMFDSLRLIPFVEEVKQAGVGSLVTCILTWLFISCALYLALDRRY